MEAVRNGGAVKRAALDHSVPRSTLQDRISCRVVHGNNSGPKPYPDVQECPDVDTTAGSDFPSHDGAVGSSTGAYYQPR